MSKPHNSLTCTAPFCKDCWMVIRRNVKGIISVANELREKGKS